MHIGKLKSANITSNNYRLIVISRGIVNKSGFIEIEFGNFSSYSFETHIYFDNKPIPSN